VALSIAGSVLGGADYLCAAAYDEPLRIPSADAAVLAVRTLEVVGMEHGIAETVDALAGSAKLAEIDNYVLSSVREELARILDQGGAVECLENGYISSLIDKHRGSRELQIASGERAWVGMNRLRSKEVADLLKGASTGEVDFGWVEREAICRQREAAASRDDEALGISLTNIEEVTRQGTNLVPPTLAALACGATIGEIIEATSRGVGGA
jgi:methylmalonyl-CoA mutase N-terminal domain/subunit